MSNLPSVGRPEAASRPLRAAAHVERYVPRATLVAGSGFRTRGAVRHIFSMRKAESREQTLGPGTLFAH